MSTDYSGFKVLLDDAATAPELGFRDYATALAEIIRDSRAEFAIGIFGTWGSGKTTLMREIQRSLDINPDIVTAWFTAWRYEKEPHLIVPLIDVLREALDKRAQSEPPEGAARKAAGAIRKAGRAFLAGLTISARLPGVEAKLDPDKVLAALADQPDAGDGSLSFYHAAFVMLRDAIEDFSQGGARRVVVFVDDLDRCFPTNALDVLESMKLFFDVEGFVFVVGLDQAVAERAVALKYDEQGSPVADKTPVSGVDYLKKIFQVPFALPRVGTDRLQEYLQGVANSAGFSAAQRADFDKHVGPHLEYLPGEDSVNPREIKRLINTYVVQLKMLRARLGPTIDPNIVLALQCMSFRPDWRELYEQLAADPALFQKTLRDALNDPESPDEMWLAGQKMVVPSRFIQYVRELAAPLLHDPNLQSYVSAAESTQSTDPSLLEAQSTVNRLRIAVDDLRSTDESGPEAITAIQSVIPRLTDLLGRRSDQPRLMRTSSELARLAKEISIADATLLTDEGRAAMAARFTSAIDVLDNDLRELRRHASLGAYAS